MKLFEIERDWRCSPMTFPSIFNKTMGQNIFGELYNTLLGFGIMIEINSLK